MATHPDLFLVMIDYGKLGREAIVDPNHSWSDALETVRAAIGDKNPVSYVLHIHDGASDQLWFGSTMASRPSLP